MIPKNHKIFIKPTAEELGVSPILVDDIVGFYYSELRKLLNDIECVSIKIDKLGTFKVKSKEVRKLHARLTTHLKVLDNPETFNQMRIKKDVEDKLEKITRINNMLKEEYERKKKIREKRNEQDKGNMAE